MNRTASDTRAATMRVWALHLAVIAGLYLLQYLLPSYHHGAMTRIMVLAVFAMGYNLLFGYVGLLSLGHALFFAAGMYGAGLPIYHLAWGVPAAFATGVTCGALLALAVGFLALRTTTVITSSYTSAYLLIVGVALIVLVLFFPKGVLGTIRERWLPWLP